ncbi:DUF4142 domain-containing protein [Roseicella aquatilis]|uniref:DUF4142 domain-containing protein n=1 Tax=Roseicella aquatilis TaxID=2527868 RepID=A0A4R4D4E1_9PROT|nr:DUF4142 domain-containing protein [Roseicella aquatilis]TCZ54657.1 DUF4142 domain-containing protein [Roseicella aquatilis]
MPRPLARRAPRAITRRAALALALLGGPALAQEAPPFDAGRFRAFAASSAEFQRQAAALAAARDTRPEVKAFAAAMLRFREDQLQRLERDVRTGGGPWPPALEPEHRVVLENLQPLDYLALSRRYMEVQQQALEQEERGYAAAARQGAAEVRQGAEAMLAEVRRWQAEARRAWAAVAP